MLAANNTLTSLNLGWNYLRNESAVAVADSLRKNHSLTTLGLAYNSFSDFATQVVIRLPHHPLSYQCGFSGALIPFFEVCTCRDKFDVPSLFFCR